MQEVSTKWNSTYLMFERIVEQFEAITTALCLLGQNHHKEYISGCLKVLKPFLEATENISGDKYVSIFMIIPLVKLLQQNVRQHLVIIPLAVIISTELTSRFSPIQGAFVTACTTLLDPCFKKLPFSSPTAPDFAVARITNEVTKILNIANHHEVPTDQEPAKSTSLWASFDQQAIESASHRTTSSEAVIEVRRYFEEPVISRSSDPLAWWNENSLRFPRLVHVTKKYLYIPGSSVPVERLFSKAGQLVSERCNHLKPKNVDAMLFLNNNL